MRITQTELVRDEREGVVEEMTGFIQESETNKRMTKNKLANLAVVYARIAP